MLSFLVILPLWRVCFTSLLLNTLFQAEVRARFWDSSGIYTVSHDFNSSGSYILFAKSMKSYEPGKNIYFPGQPDATFFSPEYCDHALPISLHVSFSPYILYFRLFVGYKCGTYLTFRVKWILIKRTWPEFAFPYIVSWPKFSKILLP